MFNSKPFKQYQKLIEPSLKSQELLKKITLIYFCKGMLFFAFFVFSIFVGLYMESNQNKRPDWFIGAGI